MTIRNLTDLRDSLPPAGRLMGLDVGRKTIGMALSDTTRTVATAFDTIRRTRFHDDVESLRRLVAEHGVSAIVIGLPVSMDGSEGPMCQSVRQFGDNLDAALGTDIAFWDERLSTAAITRTLLEADASRERRRAVKDKLAAAYILQGALDRLRS